MVDTTFLKNVSLADLCQRDGLQLRGGAVKRAPCPRCGGRDRFTTKTYEGRELFSCNQCHAKWSDAIEYLRWMHGMSFGEAVRALGGDTQSMARLAPVAAPPKPADELPPSIEWQAAMRQFVAHCAASIPASVRAYLGGRGIGDEVIGRYQIGYHDGGGKVGAKVGGQWWAYRGIVIPTSYAGSLWRVNIRRRADDLANDGRGKYVAAQGSKAALFNGDAIANAQSVLLCGGEFDALVAAKHAPTGMACASFGSETKSPTLRWRIALQGLPLCVCFDSDPTGQKFAPQWGGRVVRVPSGKDITEFWQSGGDVAGWLRGLAMSEDDSEFHALLLEGLERLGYEPYYAENGHIVAALPQAVNP